MSDEIANWRAYEAEIHAAIRQKYPDATVTFDARIQGRLSQTDRQIDVLVEEQEPAGSTRTAVEAKMHRRPIDVKHVEAFLGVVRDTGVERGIMLSASGYTAAAAQRVVGDDVDVDLDVFSLAEFIGWQNRGGLPYAGGNGAIIDAPLGWVLDPRPNQNMLAALYRRGFTLEQALRAGEFMYTNIWDRSEAGGLDGLLARQERDLLRWDRDTSIGVEWSRLRPDARTCIRRAETIIYRTAEITGFVEFDRFILFVVLFTPLVAERRNVRKLEYILRRAVPFAMMHAPA